MIRIDEIYNNTFWPWLEKNCTGTRLFFCDPFGHTDPEHLFNLGNDDTAEKNFVFMHDQEPVDVDLFGKLFNDVVRRNEDLYVSSNRSNEFGHIVVSEHGTKVQQLGELYGWQTHYYFFHGWACLDWFRGYDKTFLIDRAEFRKPTKTFISPNRIIGGKRDHRVLFLYHIFKNGLENNHISAPKICPYENILISSIAKRYCNTYPDIIQVLDQAKLPKLFSGEQTQQMTSCWLTNFSESQNSLIYVPTETVYFGNRLHITEKTMKAIALEMPFILVAPVNSLEYLRSYGFQTFSDVFDESYDQESDDYLRLEKTMKLLQDLDGLSQHERNQIHRACLPRVQHNYKHFYHGGFADILWNEMTHMLNNLQKKLS